MMKNFSDTFTASEASRLAGMNVETLRVWRRRGYFKLEGERDGWTRFTFVDVLKIATFRALTRGRLEHELAELVTANAPEQFATILRSESGDGLPHGVYAGGSDVHKQLFEIAQGPEATSLRVLQLMPRYPVVVAVDFTSIFFEVTQRLKEMNES